MRLKYLSSFWRTVKLIQQLRLGLKLTINLEKYQSKVTIERKNQNLDYLIDQIFQGVNRIFVLSFEDNTVRKGHKKYFLPTVEIKDLML